MVMEKNQLFVTVPSFFKCPISMDVMKSPVSLCTGVTYDRSSIQTWLDSGHNTCPATMQVLHTTDFVPNLTLRRLIQSHHHHSSQPPPPPPLISREQLLQFIKTNSDPKSLHKILEFAKFSQENVKILLKIDEFLPSLIRILSNVDEIEIRESVIRILNISLSEEGVKQQLNKLILKCNQDNLAPFVSLLRNGNSRTKIESARVLESIAYDAECQRSIAENNGVLYELYRLVRSERDFPVIEAGLSSLIAVTTTRPVKKELVQFGIVRTVGRVISGADTSTPVIELGMKMLEMVSTCTEGRTAICDDETCVSAVVQRLMKVSSAVTEHGIVVLWSVCYLSRDRTAQEAVMRTNGLTKVLLVMQSSCSGSVRQMCGDLVKVFRVNSKSCLASYETRTTHIMPY